MFDIKTMSHTHNVDDNMDPVAQELQTLHVCCK